MLGGSIGFLLASTTTFFLNRAITFSASRRPGQKGWIREWLKYLVVNLVGGLGDVACLDIGSRMSSSEVSLVLLVLFGSAVTAGINFILSKQFVFARA
jgi:putative flippase GtrA